MESRGLFSQVPPGLGVQASGAALEFGPGDRRGIPLQRKIGGGWHGWHAFRPIFARLAKYVGLLQGNERMQVIPKRKLKWRETRFRMMINMHQLPKHNFETAPVAN